MSITIALLRILQLRTLLTVTSNKIIIKTVNWAPEVDVRWREGGRERGREGGREGGREPEREREREGGRV
jgi:hypothetical protein